MVTCQYYWFQYTTSTLRHPEEQGDENLGKAA